MAATTPFEYRDFHDVPRAIVVGLSDGRRVMLDSKFNAAEDRYESTYSIYLLADDDEVTPSWAHLPGAGATLVGTIEVSRVHFDVTRRKCLDFDALGLECIPESRNQVGKVPQPG